MKTKSNNIIIELIQGDITKQPDADAIVNAANARLETGGGVAGAIHSAAGPGLAEECTPQAPIETGEAVISGGHDLPNKHVIHCLGPVYHRDEPSDKLLANCYRNALHLAEKNNLKTIAFPAISTGAFGYPIEEAAEIALRTFKDEASKLNQVKEIRMVLFSEKDLKIHEKTFSEIFEVK